MKKKENHFNDDKIDLFALYKERKEITRSECLTIEALEAYLHRTGSHEQLQAVERHLRQCDRCSVEWQYLKCFEAAEPQDVRTEDVVAIENQLRAQTKAFLADRFKTNARDTEARNVSAYQERGYRTRGTWKLVALAASAVLVVGLAYYAKRTPQLPGASGPDAYLVRGRPIELVSPLGALSDRPRYLSWKPIPGAIRYTVRITEVDATPVWSETVSTEKAFLPTDISANFVRMKTYYWFVEAQTEAGTLARSDRGSFAIALP